MMSRAFVRPPHQPAPAGEERPARRGFLFLGLALSFITHRFVTHFPSAVVYSDHARTEGPGRGNETARPGSCLAPSGPRGPPAAAGPCRFQGRARAPDLVSGREARSRFLMNVDEQVR